MSRVLVTGATGFIGSHCVPKLLAAGHEVHAVAAPGETTPVIDGVAWHSADLLDADSVAAALAEIRASHLLHLAWYVEPGEFWDSDANLRWLQSGIDLAVAFAENGGERCVMAGTCAEYEQTNEPFVEGVTPLRPSTLYGACKAALHLSATQYFAKRGVSFAWGHIFNLFGPREHPARLVPALARTLSAGEIFTIQHPYDVLDFLHVDDVASAFVALLDSWVKGDVNIASGEGTPIARVAGMVAAAVGRSGHVDYRAEVPMESRIVGDTARLAHEVGWTPRFGLKDGLEDAVREWRAPAEAGGSE